MGTAMQARRVWAWRFALLLGLAGCSSSHFEPPEIQGPPAMVEVGGEPRLWLLSKQEEVRQVGVGGGSSRSTSRWRTDTFYHFELQAFDPLTVQPLWKQRLLTIGDDEAEGSQPSRVIGSAAEGRVLGQDGDIVWLLIDHMPWAVEAAGGKPIADASGIEARNPELKGLLPSESRHYGFDRGLVFLSADARPFVIRGPDLQAAPYVAAPVPTPKPDLKPNGMERIVPMLPFGEVPARHIVRDGHWLGLFSEKEVADAVKDEFGDRHRFPYTILNEGSLVRRSFWRVGVAPTQRFDETFDRLTDYTPVPGSPTFLRGRFLKDLATGEPLRLASPSGLLVWHSTRIDSDGHLALTRLDDGLRSLWTTELPLSESGTTNPVRYWLLPDRVLVMGQREFVEDGVSLRESRLVAVMLDDGHIRGWNLTQQREEPRSVE